MREEEKDRFIKIAQNLGWKAGFKRNTETNGYLYKLNTKSSSGREFEMQIDAWHPDDLIACLSGRCISFDAWLEMNDKVLIHRIVIAHRGKAVHISDDIKFFRGSIMELKSEYSNAVHKRRTRKENLIALLLFLFGAIGTALFLLLGLYS